MQVLHVSEHSGLAITYNRESQLVECWHPAEYGSQVNLKVFTSKDGGKKRILASDNGYRWEGLSTFSGESGNGERKEAENCWYGTLWFGSFPYGSWCIAIRVCKHTGECKVDFFDTEINYRGVLPVDKWIDDCKSYVPLQTTVA